MTKENVKPTVMQIISDVLQLKPEQIDINDSFYADYNCSSIDFLRILSEIEGKLKVVLIKRAGNLPPPTSSELTEFRVKNLIEAVNESMA